MSVFFAISSIVKASQTGKTIDVTDKSYKLNEHGDPTQAGSVSGIGAGFNTDILEQKYTKADPKAQQIAEIAGYVLKSSTACNLFDRRCEYPIMRYCYSPGIIA